MIRCGTKEVVGGNIKRHSSQTVMIYLRVSIRKMTRHWDKKFSKGIGHQPIGAATLIMKSTKDSHFKIMLEDVLHLKKLRRRWRKRTVVLLNSGKRRGSCSLAAIMKYRNKMRKIILKRRMLRFRSPDKSSFLRSKEANRQWFQLIRHLIRQLLKSKIIL